MCSKVSKTRTNSLPCFFLDLVSKIVSGANEVSNQDLVKEVSKYLSFIGCWEKNLPCQKKKERLYF